MTGTVGSMLFLLLRRLTGAHAIAVLALYVALTSTAGAAHLITGAESPSAGAPRALQDALPGPRDPSDVYSTYTREKVHVGGSFVMASLDLPAGTYAVHALADVTAFGHEHIDCSVRAPGAATGSYRVVLDPPDSGAQAAVSGVIRVGAGRADLHCHRYSVPEQKLRLTDISLMAVRVAIHTAQ